MESIEEHKKKWTKKQAQGLSFVLATMPIGTEIPPGINHQGIVKGAGTHWGFNAWVTDEQLKTLLKLGWIGLFQRRGKTYCVDDDDGKIYLCD